MDNFKTLSEIFQAIVVSLAVLVGGGWTLYHFLFERENATSLNIKASINSSAGKNENNIVFIDIILENTGKTNIDAKPKQPSKPVYQDAAETLYHSCGLQIKQLTAVDRNVLYHWYESSDVTKVENIPEEINLIDDYEIDETGATDFWLEPGDTVHLGTAMALHSGHYLARVYFLGRKSEDYWERYIYFQVPVPNDKKGTSE